MVRLGCAHLEVTAEEMIFFKVNYGLFSVVQLYSQYDLKGCGG